MPAPSNAYSDPATHTWFPTAYTILFFLIIFVAALTWIIPAGQYDRVMNAAVGREVAVAGSYKAIEADPQGFVDVMLAPIAGFYDPESYAANAIDVSLFVLVLGGFLGIVNHTGAIDAGIRSVMRQLKGREIWMIPIMMVLFSIGGTTYGMAEETLAFYAILIPVMLAAGYDTVTAVAIILIGAGVGVLGSTINPFATVIAANAASLPFTEGMALRLAILCGTLLISILYVMRYAARVKADPSRSVVAAQTHENHRFFLKATGGLEGANLSGVQKIVLLIFTAAFAVMIWGVSSQGWWMAQMSALFLGAAVLIGVLARMGEKRITEEFLNGARELLGVALVVGLARGIVVIMEQGRIADTILHSAETSLAQLQDMAFINLMFVIQAGMSFFVPSSSGLAVLSMPILAPLSDFAGVGRDLVVTAYQSANGLVNLVNPTFAVVIGGLSVGRVSYDRWIVFIWPLFVMLTLFIMAALSVGTML
jgi:uncharacterized ion transporter superfamily protein YfcC